MKWLRKWFFALVPRYNILERKCFTYIEADKLLRDNEGKPESQQWMLDTYYEDRNCVPFVVYLMRRERIK